MVDFLAFLGVLALGEAIFALLVIRPAIYGERNRRKKGCDAKVRQCLVCGHMHPLNQDCNSVAQ